LSKNNNKFIDYYNIIGSKRILIADDERVNLLVIKKYLQSFGCNVIAVSNGEELINQYRNNPQNFDAIISDIEMPELKGDDAITKIRKYNQNIVAIAITGNNNPDYIIKVLNSGFNDYFIKGTNQEFLLMVLANQFSKTIESFEQFY
jgi:CheY-like chemotaxis protein